MPHPTDRKAGRAGNWLVTLGLIVLFTLPARGYDYSAPMEEIAHLPLTMPRQPFVLRFSAEELQRQPIWSRQVDGILMSNVAEPVIRLGAQTLRDGLIHAGLGGPALIELEPTQTNLPAEFAGKNLIVLGRPEDLGFIRELVAREKLAVTDQALNGDGFVVRPLTHKNTHVLLVTSPVSRGVLYGAYEIEERTSARGVPAIDQAFVPAVRLRSWSFYNFREEPQDMAGRWRYNLSIHYFDRWPGVLAYRHYPELGWEKNIPARIEQQKSVHRQLADATKYGAVPALIFNPFTFTASPSRYAAAREILSREHPDMIAKPSGPFGTDLSHPLATIHTLNRFNLCPSDPETRRFVTEGVRELIRTFPEIGVLGLMFSDEGGELICGCDRCKSWPYLDRIVEYSKLIIEVARSENPNIRFMPFIHGINWWIPLAQPEYKDREAEALVEIQRRVGPDFEAMMMLRSTPPGGDLQSWLFPKSTMLGRGVPLFFFFHSYEAGGPGMVAPLSPVLSHLSWPLPVYLDHLKTFLKPGQGMIGGASPVDGMAVAWWHPDLDPQQYLRNWSRAQYGTAAGDEVSAALVDTHKITEAFLLETKTTAAESFTMYRWRTENYLKPYLGDMTALKTLAKDGVTAAEGLALYDFMIPQARQPDALVKVSAHDAEAWRTKFASKEIVAIAERAEARLAKALALKPDVPDIQKLYRAAVATRSLTLLFREYHLGLIDATAGRNSADPALRQRLADQSRAHLRQAIRHVVDYAVTMLAVTNSDRRPSLARFRLDVERLYVGTSLCMVREAAFQFDQEFGGESLTVFYDQVMGNVVRE